MSKTFFILAMICFFGFPAFAQTPQTLVVRVAPETIVAKDVLTLGDIARISGDLEQTSRLQKISLGYAPKISGIREIGRERIVLAIAAAGVGKNEFALESPVVIKVLRASQKLEQSLLREKIEKAVLANLTDKNIAANVVRLDLPANVELPIGKVDCRVIANNVNNFFAPFTVSIEISVDARVVRKISASVAIEAFADVFVAAKDLTVNSKIAADDVRLEKRRLEKPLQNYVRDVQKLRGARMLKNVPGNTEILTDAIVAGYVIKAGDSIRVIGESGKVQITVQGEARAAGRVGDRIAVKNLQSNQILQAVVVDEGVVKINF